MKKASVLFLLGLCLIGCALLVACGGPCTHSGMTAQTVEPTCDQEGYILHKCDTCDYQYKTDTVAPPGHTMVESVTPPTCTEEGYTTHACACGYSYRTDSVPPVDHTYEMRTIEPQCLIEGYTEFYCIFCDHSYRRGSIPPVGHTYSSTLHEATCEKEGYTEYRCGVCDSSYRSDYVFPVGHDLKTLRITYPTAEDKGILEQFCTHCEERHTNDLLYSHIYVGGYVKNTTPIAQGIDLSCYQHQIPGDEYLPLDWDLIKEAGIDFAILKAGSTPRTENGEQKGGIDPTFEMDYRDAKAAGIDLGVYFYTYAVTEEEVRADAALLLSWLKGKQFEYPIYLDLEEPTLEVLDPKTLTEFCRLFISILRENGYYGALYCNNTWLTKHLETEPIKSFCDVWYARFPHSNPITLEDAHHWNFDKYGGQLGIWQYSQHGLIDGISDTYFDLNYAYRDYPSLIKRFCLNGYTPFEEEE